MRSTQQVAAGAARTWAGPAVGSPAPDLELRDHHGQRVSLSSYRGSRSVLVVFYPHAFSSVCSKELASLRDTLPELESADVQVLAISCDPMFALRGFADAEAIDFPLLSDFWPHGAVSAAYGVFDEGLGCSRRSTFLVDAHGKVVWVVHNSMPDPRSVDDYLAVLNAQTG